MTKRITEVNGLSWCGTEGKTREAGCASGSSAENPRLAERGRRLSQNGRADRPWFFFGPGGSAITLEKTRA